MLMHVSFTSCTLSSVCLVVFPRTRLAGEKIKIGGLALKTLKKLTGLRFTLPALSTVLANAIGLGAIEPSRIPCNSGTEIDLGSMVFVILY